MTLRHLGDVLGPLLYLGACFTCGRQFMSTHERVGRLSSGRLICARCAEKEDKP